MNSTITCTIGICLYNEAQNIRFLLESLYTQKLTRVQIGEILIVISGSTDNTLSIVQTFQHVDKRIRILIQKKREGKASAVNLILQEASEHIIVLLGGDLILEPDSIEHLITPFDNNQIGMTGARIVPLNDKYASLAAYGGFMIWRLHYYMAQKHPKLGEAIAFRKTFQRIPTLNGADEASIEPIILAQGYIIKYISSAIVHNKTPSQLDEFILQRNRYYWQHLAITRQQGYTVTSMSARPLIHAIQQYIYHDLRVSDLLLFSGILIVELYCRLLGYIDYYFFKKNHSTWQILRSTKTLN